MPFSATEFPGLYIFEPKIFQDERGYFFESYNKKTFEEGVKREVNFVQDNQSKSSYGVLRGLHYQLAPMSQAKLVRVLSGEVLDIALDIRKGSPTFGKHFSIILSAEKKNQVFIPGGFAHGFIVLSADAEFFYKCDDFYSVEHEASLKYNDPDLNIDWKVDLNKISVSKKDSEAPSFSKSKNNFTFQI
jgi:dTDP-4-dehydrorhamnose 3,5-epimerase